MPVAIPRRTKQMANSQNSISTISVNSNIDSSISKPADVFDFVSLMVHDLQGPVVSMKTLVKLLLNNRYDPQNDLHRELVKSAQNALIRSESIIHDLIDSASAEKIGMPYKPENCDLNEIITNSIEVISGSAQDYSVSLHKQYPSGKIVVEGDRNLLLRVMDNLLFNALKHSIKDSNVYVETAITGDEIIVTVRDEGSGFDNINPEDLFDKYKQISLRREGKFRGAGLGLYFCRMAINAMDGKIWAKNNSDRGASFCFALKIKKG
jgi:two-component system, OmpR family, sensor histidine kinase VicK